LKLQYKNLHFESRKLKHTCKLLCEQLEMLSNHNTEIVVEEDQDPVGFDLLQKISKFINNDAGAYKIILMAVMENMCIQHKDHVLDDDKHKQCEEMASLFLEQMQANSTKIAENDKAVRFSPQIL